MPISLGDILLHFRGESSDLEQTFSRVESEAQGWSSRVASFIGGALQTTTGILMAKGAEAAWGAVRGGLIDTNATLETSTLQFTTLMGNADEAQSHVRDLFAFAAKTPFETGPVIEASRLMYTLGGAALSTNENLGLVGDAAAAVGQPIQEVGMWVARAYNAIQSGQPWGQAAFRLQEMGVMSGDARARLEALEKSGASGTVVWAAFQQELRGFNGAMLAQATTWTGLTSTFSDIINLNVADMLRPLFEVMKSGIGGINDLLSSSSAQEWFAAAGRGIAEFASSLIEGAQRAIEFGQSVAPAVMAAWDAFSTGAAAVQSALSLVWGVVTSFVGDLGGSFAGWGDGWIQVLANGMSGAIGYVEQALGSIGAEITSWLQPNSPPQLLPALDTWGTQAAQVYLGGWGEADYSALSKFGGAIGDIVGNMVSGGDIGKEAGGAMQGQLRQQFAEILQHAKTTGSVSAESFAHIAQTAGPAGERVANLARQYVQLATASGTAATAESTLNGIQDEMKAAQGDLAFAQASGNAGLIAEARNRLTTLQAVKKDAEQKKTVAAAEKAQIEQSMKLQQMQVQAQKEQLALTKQAEGGGKAAGKSKAAAESKKAEDAAKRAADAQWKYNFAMADQQGQVEMLRAKMGKLSQDDAEYWSTKQQLGALEKRQSDDIAKKIDAKSNAEFKYAMAQATTAEKVELLKKKMAGLTTESADYEQTRRELLHAEQALAKEQERDKKGGKGGGGGGPGTKKPDDTKKENPVEQAKREIEEARRVYEAQAQAAINEQKRRIADATAQVRQAIGGLATWIGGLFPPVWSQVGQQVADGVRGMATVIDRNKPAIAQAMGATWDAVSGVVRDRLRVITDIVGSLLLIIAGTISRYGPSMTQGFITAWLSVQNNLTRIFLVVQNTVTTVMVFVAEFLRQHGTEIATTLGTAWNLIMTIITNVATILGMVIGTVFNGINLFLHAHGAQILSALGSAWTIISTVITTVLAVISGIILVVLNIIQGNWHGAWNALVATFTALWNGMGTFLGASLALISSSITIALGIVTSVWSFAWDAIAAFLGAVWTGIAKGVVDALAAMLLTLAGWVVQLTSAWTTLWTGIANVLTDTWAGIQLGLKTALTDIQTAIQNGIAGIPKALSSVIADFVTFGNDIVKGIIQGIVAMAGEVGNAISDLVQQALGQGKKEAKTGSPSQLFADELGQPIGEGVGMGVDAAAPTALSALQHLVGSLAGVPGPTLNVPGLVGAAGAAGGRAGQGAGLVIENLNVQLELPNIANVNDIAPADIARIGYLVADRIRRATRG